MNFLRSKAFLGILCFFLGAVSMFLIQRLTPGTKYSFFDSSFRHSRETDPFFGLALDDDSFESSREAFEEMQQLREKMMKVTEEEGRGLFESWYKKKVGGSAITEIKEKEDEHFFYYEISIDGLKQEKVNIRVENGQFRISGQIEQKTKNGDSDSFYSSSFHRSFPVPPNVDADKVQIHQEKNKIIVKFPKI